MSSEILTAAMATPEYQTKISKYGFNPGTTYEYAGKSYTQTEIGEVIENSFKRHLPEVCEKIGGRKKAIAKSENKLKSKVEADTQTFFGVPWYVWMLGGELAVFAPITLLFCMIGVLFSYYWKRSLEENDKQMMVAMGMV